MEISHNRAKLPSIIFHVNAPPARRFFLMTVLINISRVGAVPLPEYDLVPSSPRSMDNFPRECPNFVLEPPPDVRSFFYFFSTPASDIVRVSRSFAVKVCLLRMTKCFVLFYNYKTPSQFYNF